MWVVALVIAIAIIAVILFKAGAFSSLWNTPVAPPVPKKGPVFTPKNVSKVTLPTEAKNFKVRRKSEGFEPRRVVQDENAPCFLTGQPNRLCQCPDHKKKGKKTSV